LFIVRSSSFFCSRFLTGCLSRCSGALEIAIGALCNPGDNILIPAPGFSLYNTICENKGIEVRFYPLLPERDWEIDLITLERLIDERTVAVLVNNPSNPCGSVYSREHLQALLQVAERRRLPIISDDVYAEMVFPGFEYFSVAELSHNVPVLATGGMAKRYLVPGWRVGWISVHDRHNVLSEVRKAIFRLTTLILGANTLAQSGTSS
jgi:tyrosine aminotransferase